MLSFQSTFATFNVSSRHFDFSWPDRPYTENITFTVSVICFIKHVDEKKMLSEIIAKKYNVCLGESYLFKTIFLLSPTCQETLLDFRNTSLNQNPHIQLHSVVYKHTNKKR